jgi:hypothetical protein
MKHKLLPHPEVPRQDDHLREHLGEEVMDTEQLDEEVEQKFGPQQPADGDGVRDDDLLAAAVFAFEDPEDGEEVVPREADRVADERGEVDVYGESDREERIHPQIDHGRGAPHKEVTEELDVRIAGFADEERMESVGDHAKRAENKKGPAGEDGGDVPVFPEPGDCRDPEPPAP